MTASRVGMWVLLAGSILASLPVFASFLPVDLGVTPRLEPMPMVLDLAAAVCALGLALVFLGDRSTVHRALSHPMVLAALFVAAWSCLVAPLVDYPVLSLLGNAIYGEGAVRYAGLAVFFAAALILAGDRAKLRSLCAALVTISFAAPIIIFLLARDFFVSLDLVGHFAISGAISAWLLFAGCGPGRRLALAFAAALPALALSTNNSVIGITLLVGLPAGWLVFMLTRRSESRSGLIRAVAFAAVLLAPLIGILVKWLVPELVHLPSVHSRHLLDRVLFAALQADPTILGIGQGWGAINLTVDRYILSANAVMWDKSWDLTDRNVYHSHSLFGEALFGAGLPAVVGVLAMFVAPMMVVRSRDLPITVCAVLSLAFIGAIAHEFASTAGAVALSFALAAQRPVEPSVPAAFAMPGRAFAISMPLVSVLLLAASGWVFANANEIRTRTADIRERGQASPFYCGPQPYSALYADIELIQGLVRIYRPAFVDGEKGLLVRQGDQNLVDAYVCATSKRAESSRSPSLHIGLETFRTDVAFGGDANVITARYEGTLRRWPQKIARALNLAPDRVDLSTGFLASEMAKGNLGTVESLSRALLKRDSGDPVAMWFLGLALIRAEAPESRAEGWIRLRNALDAGILRFFPIPEQIVDEVRASASAAR